MSDKILYYAVVDDDQDIAAPRGLVRRLTFDDGAFTDEGLRKDFSWKFTPAIAEWEHGDFAYDLVEISHAQAMKIIAYFREKWGPFGQPLES